MVVSIRKRRCYRRAWIIAFLVLSFSSFCIQICGSDQELSLPQPDPIQLPERHQLDSVMNEMIPKTGDANVSEVTTDSSRLRIEPAIINPFRVATLGSEVGGIVDKICCEPGDHVDAGQILSEISKRRYDLNVRKTGERVEYFNIALERADKDKSIKSKLVNLDAASLMDLSRAEAEAEIVEHRVNEARFEYEQALQDLASCQIKAPFSGYVVIRHKEPFEIAAPLEKIITIADVSKVYAVANIPAQSMSLLPKDSNVFFKTPQGKSYTGQVARIEPSIDPKTDTRKLFVLIDNPDNELQLGTVGALELE